MGEQERAAKQPAPSVKVPGRNPAPKPKPKPLLTTEPAAVTEIRLELDVGVAAAKRLREELVPQLVRRSRGEVTASNPDVAVGSALDEIAGVLQRTEAARPNSFVGKMLEVPNDLVNKRQLLQADHVALKAQTEALARSGPPRPPAPAKTPIATEFPNISYTAHAAGPPAFDFGKVPPGVKRRLTLPILNLVDVPAMVTARFEGSAAITLQSAPMRLLEHRRPIEDGAQDIELSFVAPTPRGTHRGTVLVDLSWGNAVKPETLAIPVIALSALDHEHSGLSDRDSERLHNSRLEETNRARMTKQAEEELAAFDKAHPGFQHDAFERMEKEVASALALVGQQQRVGIERAEAEIYKYKKAPPPAAKASFMAELAMIALDIASAGVANAIAKGVEGTLKMVSKAAVTNASKQLSMQLGESTIYAISDSLKEAFKISSKRARGGSATKSTEPDIARTPSSKGLSDDPRIAFIETAKTANNFHEHDRTTGLIHSGALLRPLLFRNPDAAIDALTKIKQTMLSEAGHASETFYNATIRRWFAFISELQLDLHRAGSVDGRRIQPVRGVVDIGFQAGVTPREPIHVRTAIMRGVSNAATKQLRTTPLYGLDVPIRVYGLPSSNHAELLITVTRAPNGKLEFVDQTNGLAPGSGSWLRTYGHGDPERGADRLLQKLLGRSLEDQGIPLTTDQDPSLEGG
jgi:hypothetical protein